jgi:hypothetical protein
MRRLLLIALLAAIPTSVFAQRMFIGPHISRGPTPFHASHFNRGPGAIYLPLFYPSYPEYPYTPQYPPPQPAVIVTQSAATPTTPVNSSPPQPLLIELQGDRYVRISGEPDSQAQFIDEPVASSITPEKKAAVLRSSRSEQYTITSLIFRDGHREEVSNYSIIDGVLYASSSYFTAGAWIRKVELSSVDLPETIADNQSRGVPFRLPSAPNEVIVGP